MNYHHLLDLAKSVFHMMRLQVVAICHRDALLRPKAPTVQGVFNKVGAWRDMVPNHVLLAALASNGQLAPNSQLAPNDQFTPKARQRVDAKSNPEQAKSNASNLCRRQEVAG